MAIQIPNPGTGNGATGDNEFVLWTKVKDNFSNTTHAASRLVGTAAGKIPLAEGTLDTALSYTAFKETHNRTVAKIDNDFNNMQVGDAVGYVTSYLNSPPEEFRSASYDIWTVFNIAGHGSASNHTHQIAFVNTGDGSLAYRRTSGGDYSPWRSFADSPKTYRTTTATAANVTVGTDGSLMRASSSLKYKDVIKELELDSDLYNKAIGVNPIIYRSKSEVDPKDWHYMSFIAEELGEIDPSLTQWLVKTHDDEGNELDEPVKEAEGINLNAICAVLHATNIYQDKKLKELEQRLTALESNNEPIE